MVAWVDYFAAPSDDVAVAAIERSLDPASAFATVRAEVGPEMLVALEEFLTGVSYQENTPDLLDGRILLSHGEDELLLLVTVAAAAQVALAEADDRRLAELALRWSRVEDLTGRHDDPASLRQTLGDLRRLARQAREHGERLYGLVCT